ncbi:hypothetical protein J1G42_15460 [Cellulomonas sp. zg-ZUI222]|uniref:Tryptophan-rich sensory protein n=1 Tax=Cellulomonas wangleii TaxID=2816956 RepID=A0ABX8D9S6_9CELL|nr:MULTISPECIES: hypothetical protein [Cellulomonas]MBO0901661.1 hypothetical protein [Cellulomonas sp. zg-ZUI22]MBO0922220.1 hypothetical protein [Cellulomonas wangleii]MBO0925915.1 hypothetical protein [Cellulomonas wangleii]QVI63221.1 hypothetical protein KG103_04795 [Cellulomonas wangleii]
MTGPSGGVSVWRVLGCALVGAPAMPALGAAISGEWHVAGAGAPVDLSLAASVVLLVVAVGLAVGVYAWSVVACWAVVVAGVLVTLTGVFARNPLIPWWYGAVYVLVGLSGLLLRSPGGQPLRAPSAPSADRPDPRP